MTPDDEVKIIRAALLDSSNALVPGTLPESAANGLAALELLRGRVEQAEKALAEKAENAEADAEWVKAVLHYLLTDEWRGQTDLDEYVSAPTLVRKAAEKVDALAGQGKRLQFNPEPLKVTKATFRCSKCRQYAPRGTCWNGCDYQPIESSAAARAAVSAAPEEQE